MLILQKIIAPSRLEGSFLFSKLNELVERRLLVPVGPGSNTEIIPEPAGC